MRPGEAGNTDLDQYREWLRSLENFNLKNLWKNWNDSSRGNTHEWVKTHQEWLDKGGCIFMELDRRGLV
jgi:hypothetical protein